MLSGIGGEVFVLLVRVRLAAVGCSVFGQPANLY